MNQDSLSGACGVSQQTISKIERDISTMSVELLIGLAQYFNVTTDYILGLTDEKRNLQLENRMSLGGGIIIICEWSMRSSMSITRESVSKNYLCSEGLQGNEEN